MSEELPDPIMETPQEKSNEAPIMTEPAFDQAEVKKKNKKEFWYGVGLFFVMNIVMGLCFWGVQFAAFAAVDSIGGMNPTLTNLVSGLSAILGFLPFIINVGVIIYLVVKNRPQVALGMLAGFGVALVIVICLGVILMGACFVALGAYSG